MGRSAGNRQGISKCLQSGHAVNSRESSWESEMSDRITEIICCSKTSYWYICLVVIDNINDT